MLSVIIQLREGAGEDRPGMARRGAGSAPLAVVLTLASVAHAQERVYLFSRGDAGLGVPASLLPVQVGPNEPVQPAPALALPAHAAIGAPALTNGGTSLVWLVATAPGRGPVQVARYDSSTGRARILPGIGLPDPGDHPATPGLAADNSRLRAFLTGWSGERYRLDANGQALLATVPAPAGAFVTGMHVRDDRLLLTRQLAPDVHELLIVDVDTGARQLQQAIGAERIVRVSDDGRRLYLRWEAPAPTIRVVEVETWTTLASRTWADGTVPGVVASLDETRGLLILVGGPPLRFEVLDAHTLADVVSAPTGTAADEFLAGGAPTGGVAPIALVTQSIPTDYSRCGNSRLHIFSGRTGQSLLSASLARLMPLTDQVCAEATAVRTPLAPTGLSASVDGATVRLSWTAPLDATSFRLEAGSTGGASDLLVRPLGRETTVTVPDVPAGTYFVRVRGVNALGTGAASRDVRVTVGPQASQVRHPAGPPNRRARSHAPHIILQ